MKFTNIMWQHSLGNHVTAYTGQKSIQSLQKQGITSSDGFKNWQYIFFTFYLQLLTYPDILAQI